MICPKCGSENVEFSRETGSIIGATSGQGKIKTKGKVNGISITSNNVSYKTVALCKDCGWSWQVKGEKEEKDAQAAKGCVQGCLLVVCLIIIVASVITILTTLF